MAIETENKIIELKETLMSITKENKNGVLICKAKDTVGEIHFFSGKLIYAIAYKHRVRRWKRALIKYSIKWEIEPINFTDIQPWEYQLLHHGVGHKQISLTQVKDIIRATVTEALFELSSYSNLELIWQNKDKTESGLAVVLALTSKEVSQTLEQVMQLRNDWDKAGLRVLSPTLAPIGKLDNMQEKLPMLSALDGKLSLWDLAIKQQKSISELTNLLIPYIRKGVVKFREIPDLSNNIDSHQATAKITSNPQKESQLRDNSPVSSPQIFTRKKALIACIDDSPVVAHNIKKILNPVGYEILAIPEPMHGFSELIEHKPDLILLDINMPNANGYSVCQFLRNSPIFEKTPIIILTGQDTNIDRARAKLVGATDFMGKPPEAEVLLKLVEQYLAKSA